ncbi:Putative ribonuclease H protein At1g65750, partial [Linum perenne]
VSGLQLAWDWGYRKVQLQLDSRCAVSLLQSNGLEDHAHTSTIHSARYLIRRDWEVQIIHVHREGNHVADLLASRGHSLSVGFHCIKLSNPILSYWLLYDQFGGSEERLIINQDYVTLAPEFHFKIKSEQNSIVFLRLHISPTEIKAIHMNSFYLV